MWFNNLKSFTCFKCQTFDSSQQFLIFWNHFPSFTSIDLWLSHNQIPIRKQVLLFCIFFDSLNAKTVKIFRAKYQTTCNSIPIQNFRMLRFHIFCDYMVSLTTLIPSLLKLLSLKRGYEKNIWDKATESYERNLRRTVNVELVSKSSCSKYKYMLPK